MRLQDWAQHRGYRNAELARALDASESAVSKWLTGKRVPGLFTLRRIAELTEGAVTIDDWFVEDTQPGEAFTDFFELLATGRTFPVIYADPPWDYLTRSPRGRDRHPERHYPVMSLAKLAELPVKQLAAKDAHLFLWTTAAHLPHALQLMRAWGFAFSSSAFVWVKLRKNADARGFMAPRDLHMSLGKTSRKGSEWVLLGRRGSPIRRSANVREVIHAPIGKHSAKPEDVRRAIQSYSAGPYLELFARGKFAGWTTWGNEVDGRSAQLADQVGQAEEAAGAAENAGAA